MSKLMLLKNGDSVRSDAITYIRIAEFVPISEYQSYEIKDRVLIDHGKSNISMIYFETVEECKKYIEELTKLINEVEDK